MQERKPNQNIFMHSRSLWSEKKSDDHGLCENDIPTLNFTRAYRPRHITIGSNSFKLVYHIIHCFASIFSKDTISGVSDEIYFL